MPTEREQYQKPSLTELEGVDEAEEIFFGVKCRVYKDLTKDDKEDYALIEIDTFTRQQLMVDGEYTSETWLDGPGLLSIERANREIEIHVFDGNETKENTFQINLGDKMQWISLGEGYEKLRAWETVKPAFHLKPERFVIV